MEQVQLLKDDQDSEDASSSESAFTNHMILEKIFANCCIADLKNFRLVNRVWCSMASARLRKEKLLKVRMFNRMDYESVLANVLNRSFPATELEQDFGDIGKNDFDPDVADSCIARLNMIRGHEAALLVKGVAFTITSLGAADFRFKNLKKFRPMYVKRVVTMFEKILFGVMNIGTLTVDFRGSANYRTVQSMVYKDFYLPHLQQVTFNFGENGGSTIVICEVICSRILKAAPNLKLIKGKNVHWLFNEILRYNKEDCLRNYEMFIIGSQSQQVESFESRIQNTLRISKRFLEACPALESFRLPELVGHRLESTQENTVELKTMAINMLIKFRSTLRTATITHLSFLDGYNRGEEPDPPVFRKLTSLEFQIRVVLPLFPQEFSPSVLFPCLRKVKLGLLDFSKDNLRIYFSQKEDPGFLSLPSVTTLELACMYDIEGMKMLAKIFPNVINFIFSPAIGSYEHELRNGVWNLPPRVESVTVHVVAQNFTSKVGNLDELFTGIGRKVLRTLPRDIVQNEAFANSSRHGVRKLKGLKYLKVIFDVNDRALLGNFDSLAEDQLNQSSETPFFLQPGTLTVLSGLYAFNTQHFRTCFSYDKRVHCARAIQRILEPLQPYISIDPNFASDTTPDLRDDLIAKLHQEWFWS